MKHLRKVSAKTAHSNCTLNWIINDPLACIFQVVKGNAKHDVTS